MDALGLNGVASFEEQTGLNRNIYYTLNKDTANFDMSLVVTLALTLKLDSVSTALLLNSAGLSFNLNNYYHKCYLFILSYFQDCSLEICNEILDVLNVPDCKKLGAHHREPYKIHK